MADHPQIARDRQIDVERLEVFLGRGWLSPAMRGDRPVFRDVDIARAALIDDLANEFGINDEGIDLVLQLLDQLYSLRFACRKLIDAMEAQPQSVRLPLAGDARQLAILVGRKPRSRR